MYIQYKHKGVEHIFLYIAGKGEYDEIGWIQYMEYTDVKVQNINVGHHEHICIEMLMYKWCLDLKIYEWGENNSRNMNDSANVVWDAF